MKIAALALAAVLVLALTVLVSTGSAADVYSHSPKVDVYSHAANVHPGPVRVDRLQLGARPGRPLHRSLPGRPQPHAQGRRPRARAEDGRPQPRRPRRRWAVKIWAVQRLVARAANQTRGGCAAVPAPRRCSAAVDRGLRALDALGVERLDGVGGARDERLGVVVRLEVREHPVGERPRVAALRAGRRRSRRRRKSWRLQVLRDRAQAVVARRGRRRAFSSSRPRSKSPSSWTTSTALGLELEEARRGADRAARTRSCTSPASAARACARRAGSRRAGPENFERHEPPCRRASSSTTMAADVVAVARVLAAGIAEPDDEQVERRALTPRPEPHGYSPSPPEASASGSAAASAASPSAASPSAPRPRPPRGELLLGGLGLDDAGRRGDRGDDRLGIVEQRDALRRGEVARCGACRRSPCRETSRSRCSGTSSGSASTLTSRSGCESTPPSRTPGASSPPMQLHRDRGVDRLVEPDLLQVDVRDAAAHLVDLVLLEDRRVRLARAVDLDVEDRVEARRAGERAAQLALRDGDRDRLAAAVEHARDEPLLAQAARLARAEPLALGDDQLGALSGHSGGGV